ncbi:transposase [Scytonema sp. NUACC26]
MKLLQQFAIILKEFVTIFLIELHKSVMEGINNRIKLIKRQAYGFVNF